MKVSVEEVNKSPGKKLEINFSDYIDEIGLNDRVSADLTASAVDCDLNIRGKIKAEVLLQCDRCLESYVHSVNVEINEDFSASKVIPDNQKDYELTKDEFVEELGNSKEVDVKNLIYQLILLDLPGKNLCKADCPGFYETGSDKTEEIIDERLEVFKRFSENILDEN